MCIRDRYRRQKDIENGRSIVVGVNRYETSSPPIESLQTIDTQETRRQLDRLSRAKDERDGVVVQKTLSRLEQVAKGSENTMPAIVECVEAYATLGEISDVFRKVFGEQKELATF